MSEHSQPPGAVRIRKGPIDVLVLSEDDVRAALTAVWYASSAAPRSSIAMPIAL